MSAPGAHLAPRVATGVCGSGKTWRMMAMTADVLRSGYRVIALDANSEWNMAERPLVGSTAAWARVTTAAGAAAALEKGAQLVIVRAAPDDSELPLQAAAEALARVAAESAWETILVVPEVHQVIRNPGRIPPHLRALIHRFRHLRAALWVDTQHFRDIHTEILDAAGWVYVHATGSARDWARLTEWGSPELAEAAKAAADRMRGGEPGWHVAVPSAFTAPPYELRR